MNKKIKYNEGVTKILVPQGFYGHIDTLAAMADHVGHEAFEHNGMIYVKNGKTWVKTPFVLSDFETI